MASIVPEAKECGAKLVFGAQGGCRFGRGSRQDEDVDQDNGMNEITRAVELGLALLDDVYQGS